MLVLAITHVLNETTAGEVLDATIYVEIVTEATPLLPHLKVLSG